MGRLEEAGRRLLNAAERVRRVASGLRWMLAMSLLLPAFAGAQVPEPVIQSHHSRPITVLLALPGADLLASGSQDGTVKLWAMSTQQLLATYSVSPTWIRSLAFDTAGTKLAAGTGDHRVHIYDIGTGKRARTIHQANSAVTSVAFSPDGQWLYLKGGRDPTAYRCGVADGACVAAASVPPSGTAAANPAGVVGVATANQARLVWQRPRDASQVPLMDTSALRVLRFSPDDSLIAVGTDAGDVVLWNLASGEARGYQRDVAGQTIYYASSLAFSPDGSRLSAIRSDKRDRWTWTLSREPPRMPPRLGDTSGATFDAFREWGADVGGPPRPNPPTIFVDGMPTTYNTLIAVSAASHPTTVFTGSMVPDFLTFITAQDAGTGREWTHRGVRQDGVRPSALAISANGGAIAVAYAGGTIEWLDGRTGQPLRRLSPELSRSPLALAFSADGRMLAAGNSAGEVNLWTAGNAAPLKLPGHGAAVLTLAFSPDGAELASGGMDNTINRWDIRENRALPALTGHASAITSLAYAHRLDVLASGSEDGTMKVWNAETGRLLATAVAPAPDTWLTMSAEGFFDGTRASWNAVPFRVASRPRSLYRPEQFFSLFFQPGLLAEAVATRKSTLELLRDANDPRARLNVSRLIDSHLPEVRLRAGAVADGSVQVHVDVRDAGSGIRDLRIFRNDSLVHSVRGNLPASADSRTHAITVPVALAGGTNEISAYAFNHDDVKSADAILRVDNPAPARPGTVYVLSVGIDRYSNADFKLNFAASDADRIARVLEGALPRAKQYPQVVAARMTNEMATKANVLAALRRLAGSNEEMPASAGQDVLDLRRARPEDSVVFFFAGHGGAAGDRYYLLAQEVAYAGSRAAMQPSDWAAVYDRAISDQDLDVALEKIDAGRVMVIIDACQSGAVLQSGEPRRGPLNTRGIAQLAYEKGAYVLAAAQRDAAAREPRRLGHGVLTHVLIERGIEAFAADLNGDGTLTVQEWFRYAGDQVPRELSAGDDEDDTRPLTIGGVPLEVQRPQAYYRRGSPDDWLITRSR